MNILKQKIIAICLIVLSFSPVIAQQAQHDIKVSYGPFSGNDLATTIGGVFLYVLTLGLAGEPEMNHYGSYIVSYNRRVNKRVSLGVQLNYNPIDLNFPDADLAYKFRYTSLLGKFDFRYIANPKFEMYGNIMLGATADFGDYKVLGFTGHINPLCFRHGKKHGVFYELGIGSGPYVSLGYSAKL